MKSPLITMSAVTGKPNRNDIYNYLKSLKDNGIEQALIYPRSGCEIEYLSEEWFTTIGNFIKCAAQLDMHLWLYDDFNWPSGDACGRVTKNHEYRLKSIITKGDELGKISYKSRHNSGLFGEKYFPNLLSYEAVDYFIECTHEEYYKRFKEYFGNVVQGIFTDEPSIGYCCEGFSIPYYEGIENDYRAFCSRDFNDDMVSSYDSFYLNAITVISNRFNACYISRLTNWCKEHGIIMTGHLMCDSDPFHATKHNGDFLKNLSTFTLPGIDEIFTDFTDPCELTLFGAIQYASGDRGAMAELFALGPCDMSYAKKRCMLYLASAFKIDHYFLAISHMDVRGNLLVTDFFNNFSTAQPDFSGIRLLANDAIKASKFAKRDFMADVYIRYPFTACAKSITNNLNLDSFCEIVNGLSYRGVQWKFINTECPANTPIIEFNDQLEPILNGKNVSLNEIYQYIGCSTTITNKNGNMQAGIFVRKYNDGSMLILNLFAPPNEYIIDGESIFLDRYAVKFSNAEKEYTKEEITTTFNVTYDNYNIIRTMHINDREQIELSCEGDFDVIFATRNGTQAYLSDALINCQNEGNILPSGFNCLYKISDTVSLNNGVSIIKATNDLKYLPSVFIVGDFEASCSNDSACKINLSKRKHTFTSGDNIYDYGKVSFSAKLFVPDGAIGIEIEGTTLYTRVYSDDRLLDEKITSPYIFNVDKSLWGKGIALKIEQLSSIGNIFGNVDLWDKATEKSQWRGTPNTKKTFFGFNKINWVFE